MKRVIALLTVIFCISSVYAMAETKTTTVSDLETLVYETEEIKFNNFTITEGNNMFTDPEGYNHIKVQVSGRNKKSTSYYVQLQIVGFGTNGKVLWAMKAAPTMGILSENSLEQLSGTAWVRPETLQNTEKLLIIFAGDFLN